MAEDCRFTAVAKAISAAPSADNSQPFRIGRVGEHITLAYRPHPGRDPFGAKGHGTLISIGAAAENAAQICGVNEIDWQEGDDAYFSLRVPEHLPAGRGEHPLFGRHTNRMAYATPRPDEGLVRMLGEATQGACRVEPLIGRETFGPILKAARVCCHARFCTRELHEWLMGSLRFTPAEVARGDGLDIRTVNLPPAGGVFMRFIQSWPRMSFLNRLQVYRVMAQAEMQTLGNASMILPVVGRSDYQGALDAGRLIERIWIELNRQGWAVHPYYVIVDQQTRFEAGRLQGSPWQAPVAAALEETRRTLGLAAGERLHIMLRVGRPKRAVVRSLRLPLQELFPGVSA